MRCRWVISCEHGGNEIPAAYAAHFEAAESLLNSHRGWDPGALALYRKLQPLADFSHSATTSRLLVELNRSRHHPSLFSVFSKKLDEASRGQVLEQYYFPYRHKLEAAIKEYIGQGDEVVHLSIHSFTPVLEGEVRNADFGLLYDPGREREKKFCASWKELLLQQLPGYRLRFNYPYKGTADGFTTYLRKQFPHHYAGIEFELNQDWVHHQQVYQGIYQSLQQLKNLNG